MVRLVDVREVAELVGRQGRPAAARRCGEHHAEELTVHVEPEITDRGDRRATADAGTSRDGARLLEDVLAEEDQPEAMRILYGVLPETERKLAQAEARLADPAFVDRAPAEVVTGARQRAEELRDLVTRLAARMAR